jgi:hypothetical protein
MNSKAQTKTQSPSLDAQTQRVGILQRKCDCGQHTVAGGECGSCQDKQKEKLQRSAVSRDGLSSVPPVVDDVLRSNGQTLDAGTRRLMESGFGHDFSQVRVHTDAQAASSARSINALAYTMGRDVVFGAGQYAPGTMEGNRLLAHELTHVVQQREGHPSYAANGNGTSIVNDASLEQKADERAAQIASVHAHSALSHEREEEFEDGPRVQREQRAQLAQRSILSPSSSVAKSSHAIQRQPAQDWGPGWWEPGWEDKKGGYVKGWNKGEKKVGKIRRLPLDHLGSQGNQDEDAGRAGTDESAKGRAIVLLHEDLKADKPVQVLLHFHGWHNIGYRQNKSSGQVRDEATDRIEQQLEASTRPQMIGVLPQGNYEGEFGKNAAGKTFNSDAYLKDVFATLVLMAIWKKMPDIDNVILSGHSHAGELINETMLSGSNQSSLPSKLGEIVLFDAINGPNEFAGVKAFLTKRFDQDIAELNKRQKTDEKTEYLKTSLRFRVYHTTDPYYTKWLYGPLPQGQTPPPLKQFLDDMFKAHETELGGTSSDVYKSLRDNYKIVATGHGQHDDVVGKGDHLKEAIGDLHRSPDGQVAPRSVPSSVYEVLRAPGQPLEAATRETMEDRFNHDFGRVRVHTDARAVDSARAVGAQAYTVGHHVVFGAGQYSSSTSAPEKLLAHELTHVVQQSSTSSLPFVSQLSIVPPDHVSEREAAAHADSITGPETITGPAASTGFASPMLQRQPAVTPAKPIREAVCETTANPTPAAPGDCTYKEPENCTTYEQWISTFTRLKSFDAAATPHPGANEPSTFHVIGGEAAAREPKTAADKGAAPPSNVPDKAEKFIDHPTDEWVKTCLPDNLRATAYQLPSDCADIAVILRHVWLSAHHRTETFGTWTIGSKAGKDEAKTVGKVINEVYTGNVSALVNPYTDKNGEPLRSFNDLAPMLHVGDILVWEHLDKTFTKRTGGHTHTIASVHRDPDSGKITSLGVLQGNEPIFGSAKPIPKSQEPEAGDDKTKIIREMKSADTEERRTQLGHLPGRRIETDTLTEADFGAHVFPPKGKDGKAVEVWQWGGDTLLVVAGPPKAAARPPMQAAAKGEKKVRRLTDWVPSFQKATTDNMFGVFEAATAEARGMIEGGQTVSDDDARALGEAAGQMVWRLAKKANDLGEESHFKIVNQMRAVLSAIRGSSNQPVSLNKPVDATSPRMQLVRLFGIIDDAFNLAARGSADITFSAPGVKAENLVKTLLTGFDPFNTTDSSLAPRPGEWNPSGAAVLALDGKTVDVDKGVKAALEGVVLPVNFDEFKGGMVEKMLKPHIKDVDAVLTVSVDPGIAEGGAVRLERYAVGSHLLNNGTLEPVPAAPGGGSAGAAIIETDAPLEKISAETAQPAKGKSPEIPAPTFGNDITFEFDDKTQADSALKALGLAAQGIAQVSISDHAALQKITQTMTREATGPGITFTANGKSFHALVLSGPGGNFLSNEVSYRTLRLIAETKSDKNPTSFHTHTEKGNLIPQDTSTPAKAKERTDALKKGMGIRDRLISTLQRMVQSVARLVMERRKTAKTK